MILHPGKSYFLMFLLLFITFYSAYPQVPHNVISTLSMASGSHTLSKGGSIISFPQSIGQSSVTGVFRNSTLSARQGFIQPLRMLKPRSVEITFDADIYPNPFTEDIMVSFPDFVSDKIQISLYDLQGKILFSRQDVATAKIELPFKTIPAGFYILKIKMGNQILTRKIVKALK